MSFSIDDYTWPAYQGRKPFIHQKHTVKFAIGNKRAFILNDMGTGKTLAALWACDILLTAQKIRKVLIISPLSTMRSVWFNEIALNLPHRKVSIAHGNAQIRSNAIKQPVHFVIMNHDGIKYTEDEIIREQFDVIIIDELTAYKSHSSERSKCMKRIADAQDQGPHRARSGAVWGMTGEITPNAPTEAFFQCKIVNPHNKWLPRYFGQFRDACMKQVNEVVWIPKPESPQVVAMCTQPAIRFTRDQCLDLPDTMYRTVDIPLSSEQAKYYDQMRSQALLEVEMSSVTAVNAAVLLNKLLQISAGAVKTDSGEVLEIGCKERIDHLVEIFEESPQRKLVVFATYRASIELLVRDLTSRRIKCAAIHGDVNQNTRASHIDRFQRGDLEILVLQPQSSAHGITLTAASNIVWFSLIPSNELFQQGNARIVRAGQTRKTFITMLVSTKAEKHIAAILQRKGDLSREVLQLFNDHDL
jgi:SNF2 family DNA or RNA helicase